MRIVPAIEKQPVQLPLAEVLGPDLQGSIPDDVRRFVDIDFRDGKLVLVAGSSIGLIPLTAEIALDIQPKFPIGNLGRILSVAEFGIPSLDSARKQYQADDQPVDVVFVFLVECLLTELRGMITLGEERRYSASVTSTSSPTGRLLTKESMTLWVQGRCHQVAVRRFEFTKDTPRNRLIKLALRRCLDHAVAVKLSSQLVNELSELYDRLRYVPLDRNCTFLGHQGDTNLGIRKYYKESCRLSELLIAGKSLDLLPLGDAAEAMSFVVDLAVVFENYLLAILSRDTASLSGIQIQSGNKSGMRGFYKEHKNPPAKPDIIVRHKGAATVLIDAKYKEGIKERDRYQVVAHAVSYDTAVAVLCAPAIPGHDGLEFQGTAGSRAGVEVYHYYIDLNDDLPQAEQKFSDAILSLLGR